MKDVIKKRSYRIDEVAKYLRTSIRTIYRLIETGDLIAFRFRKRGLRITDEALEAYIKRQIIKFQEEIGLNE